jgi:hypothetical protein
MAELKNLNADIEYLSADHYVGQFPGAHEFEMWRVYLFREERGDYKEKDIHVCVICNKSCWWGCDVMKDIHGYSTKVWACAVCAHDGLKEGSLYEVPVPPKKRSKPKYKHGYYDCNIPDDCDCVYCESRKRKA